jgi:site-specific DNA recombinase
VARQRQRLLEAYLAEVIDLDTFQRQDRTLAGQEADLRAREREVTAQGEQLAQVSGIAHSMTQVLKQLRVGLDQANFQQRRQLVELLIDRVVVTDGQVEIRYVIPTTPGSTKTRFCHLRTDYFHLIALAIAGPVKGRRPATTRPFAGAAGLLVVPLRDGVGDVAGAQGGAIGPAGIGLVPGQVIRSRAGPAAAARPGHPHGIDQPDQLASVGVLPRGQASGQVPTPTVADGVQLGAQPTPGAPQRLLPTCLDRREPPLRAPAACW